MDRVKGVSYQNRKALRAELYHALSENSVRDVCGFCGKMKRDLPVSIEILREPADHLFYEGFAADSPGDRAKQQENVGEPQA
ncbi:MAG: hypothetical protein LBB80_00965 [Treponema sp.]|jgi:hypothetical protein|nr:hypothetical protein [Treponema sp.]